MTKLPFFLLLLLAITVPSSYASIGYVVEDDYERGYERGFERGFESGFEKGYDNCYDGEDYTPCDDDGGKSGIISPKQILAVTIAGIIAAAAYTSYRVIKSKRPNVKK